MHEQGSVDWKSGFEFRNSSGMARFPLPVWDVGWLGHSIGGIFKFSLVIVRICRTHLGPRSLHWFAFLMCGICSHQPQTAHRTPSHLTPGPHSSTSWQRAELIELRRPQVLDASAPSSKGTGICSLLAGKDWART